MHCFERQTLMNVSQPSHDIIGAALDELDSGKPIILCDDADRENEGDLVYIASKISKEAVSFMMEHGKGLICMSLTAARMKELGLSLQVKQNESMFGTNFATPFDHSMVHDAGITAASRAYTIQEAARVEVDYRNFVTPGFVVPVVARPGGVLQRRGQTEGSSDLARLAGYDPYGVICEVMDQGGSMLSGSALEAFAREHRIICCSVGDLVEYRKSFETSIRLVEEKTIPLSSLIRSSLFTGHSNEIRVVLKIFHDDVDGMEHFALHFGDQTNGVPVRIHSECLTGDVFGSLRCDCGPQLDAALSCMIEKGSGVLIYLQQEGRGIGLANKLRAYELQEKGMDTVDANIHLGLPADSRDYRVAANILKLMNIHRVSLLTNNPAKMQALAKFSIEVEKRIPLEVTPQAENMAYLQAKRQKMGHLLGFQKE
jgi:3,4-dihydroxy 2-butanone 4-phosphate synthase / GTP cyclohydrolase II